MTHTILPSDIRRYLNKRFISDAMIEERGIHWDAVRQRIVIPVRNGSGDFLFNKYRSNPLAVTSGPKYFYDKGSTTEIYGLEFLNTFEGSDVVITEGELDSIVLNSFGIPAISSTGGSHSWRKDWHALLAGKNVFVCFDADNAGAEGAIKTHLFIPGSKIICFPIIRGVKDVTDFFTVVENPKQRFMVLKMNAISLDLPEIPEALPQTKAEVNAILSAFTDSIDKFVKIRRDSMNEGLSDIYPNAVLKYLSDEYDYYKHLRHIMNRGPREGFDQSRISRAKRYPIPRLVKVNEAGFLNCIWHNDKNPSMKYYEKTNTIYCFACARSGDAIDVYKELHFVSIKNAIDDLLQLNGQ